MRKWILLALLLLPAVVSAQTVTTQFQVLAVVQGQVAVSAVDIDFGTMVNDNSWHFAAGQVDVTCAAPIPYTVDLNEGFSGVYPWRLMDGGLGNTAQYNIYTDAAYNNIWGDASAGTVNQSGIDTATFTMFARARTTDAPGNYVDTITVTVTY